MPRLNNFRQRTTGDIRIRVSQQQKQHLKNLSEAQGYRSLSDFIRTRIFDDLSVHEKLNQLMIKLEANKNSGKEEVIEVIVTKEKNKIR